MSSRYIPIKLAHTWALALSFLMLLPLACTSQTKNPPEKKSAVMDQQHQAQMTPDQALAELVEGNIRFVSGKTAHYDYARQVKATSAHQYPMAVILACMDSRTSPSVVFDQGLGSIFELRVAGNYSTPDLLGSMEYATKVAGAKLVVVLGHSECGAIKGACDDVELGNLTTVIKALQPAVKAVQDLPGERNSKNKQFVQAVAVANVRHTVEKIRSDSPILRQLEQAGQIKIIGAMYDVKSGQAIFYSWKM